jgi:hypothetical protein
MRDDGETADDEIADAGLVEALNDRLDGSEYHG